MIEGLAWLIGGIAFGLGGVHAYWVFGGRKGFRIAVPTKGEGGGEPMFRPTKAATAVVALMLALMGVFVLQLGGIGASWFPEWSYPVGGWLLTAVFVLRAIGDFRWLGFFKRNGGTPFARMDSILYSPLCLFLGAALAVITSAAL